MWRAALAHPQTSGGGDATISIGDEAHAGDEYITTTIVTGTNLLQATGWSSTNRYYANFIGVLAHKREHQTMSPESATRMVMTYPIHLKPGLASQTPWTGLAQPAAE